MDKSPKVKRLYKVLFILMDIESVLWDIAEFIIKPVAKCRGFVTRKIAKEMGIEEPSQEKIDVKM